MEWLSEKRMYVTFHKIYRERKNNSLFTVVIKEAAGVTYSILQLCKRSIKLIMRK